MKKTFMDYLVESQQLCISGESRIYPPGCTTPESLEDFESNRAWWLSVADQLSWSTQANCH